jgi:hypothetical protein
MIKEISILIAIVVMGAIGTYFAIKQAKLPTKAEAQLNQNCIPMEGDRAPTWMEKYSHPVGTHTFKPSLTSR